MIIQKVPFVLTTIVLEISENSCFREGLRRATRPGEENLGSTGRYWYPYRPGASLRMQYGRLFAEQARGTERARARGRPLLKKLRRGLWRFNCSPRLWLESSKTPFASDAGSVTLLNALQFLVTYGKNDDEEEKRCSRRLTHFGAANYCFVARKLRHRLLRE